MTVGVHHTMRRAAVTLLPTEFGDFTAHAYVDPQTGIDHVALVATGSTPDLDAAPLVRVHSECLTGDAFGSTKCECGPQLRASLERVQRDGGIVIYLRGHEGRGIGLANKLRAYELQEQGLDTLDANLALGFPADARDYAPAAGILHDLEVPAIRLLSNNPDKATQLSAHGITVSGVVPLVTGIGTHNTHYLETKRDRMGHTLPHTLSPALA